MAMQMHGWSRRQKAKAKRGRRLFSKTPFFKKRKRRGRKNESWERGKTSERRVLIALQSFPRPSWVLGVRAGSPPENRFRAKDIVILTRVGPIGLQVKSSLLGLIKFVEKMHDSNPWTGVVAVLDHESPETIAENVWRILGIVHDNMVMFFQNRSLGQ